MTTRNGLTTDERKTVFLVALKELDGNVSKACKAADVSRQAYYNWMENDDEFSVSVKMVQLKVTEEMLDEAEEVIRFALKRSDRETAKWVLSRLGKNRGYGNRIEISGSQGAGFRGLEYPEEPASVTDWESQSANPTLQLPNPRDSQPEAETVDYETE